jgi:hypothetical protein
MRPFIKTIIVLAIIFFSLKLGCSRFAEFSREQGWTQVCGLTYDEALDKMIISLRYNPCPDSSEDQTIKELKKIYRKHYYWDLTDEQRTRFYKLLKNPCEAPPDPNNQLMSGLQELGEIAIIAYFGYCMYTFPLTIVIILVIIVAIVDKSTKAVEVAIKDKPHNPQNHKERKWNELEDI